jgi:putative membrane protein
MKAEGLVHAESHFPPSFTLVTAFLLLAIGIVASVSMIFNVGPF